MFSEKGYIDNGPVSIVIAEKLESFSRYRDRTKRASLVDFHGISGNNTARARARLPLRSEGMRETGGYIYEDRAIVSSSGRNHY